MEPYHAPRLLAEALRLREDHLLRAGIEAEAVKAAVQAAYAVVRRLKQHHQALVRHENRHRRVAADLFMFLFAVQSAGQERLFHDRLRLDVFRNEIDDLFALQIDLPVLLAAAEDPLRRVRRQGKFIAPPFLACDLQAEHICLRFGKGDAHPALPFRKDQRPVCRLFQPRERRPFLLHDRLLHGPAVRGIGLFLQDREDKRFFRGMQRYGAPGKGDAPAAVFDLAVHM